MGPGESNYESIKPFARDGTGALWVRPYFQVFATDDDHVDSHSIIRQDDGQESLDTLIDALSEQK